MINLLLRTPNRVSLILTLLGLVSGLAIRLAGASGLADMAWMLATLYGLLSLAGSIARDLARRRVGVDVIAVLAMAGALAVGEYLAGAIIAVMLSTGRFLEDYANNRARRELSALIERAPHVVHRYEDGALTSPPLEDVRLGDLLLVKPGEVVPVDGTVVGTSAVLDESALTGEPGPVERQPGEQVLSGALNVGPPFDMRATTTAAESTYAGIVRLVQEAQASKAPFVRLADRFAAAFVPLTLLLASIAWIISGDPVRAVAVLVVATPCPLILAAPIAIVAGISRAAQRGIIIKDGRALESLGKAKVLLFDKTGTLTAGRPAVAGWEGPDYSDADELLRLAASLDQMSPHVLADAIVRAARARNLELLLPSDVVEEPGYGIHGTVDGHTVAVGKADWVSRERPLPRWVGRLRRRAALEGLLNVFVAIDGSLKGALILEDPIRPDTPRTIRMLRKAGIKRITMVTGDRAAVAELIGAVVGVDRVIAERSPAEKVDVVHEERLWGPTIMVGDGINDAPALAAADVGVALAARGATASSEAADIVLVVDRLDRLADALQIARRARGIALQSVLVGMGLSLVAMLIAAMGKLPPVAGASVQEAIDVAVILNALRALGGYQMAARKRPSEVALSQRFRTEHVELLPLVNQIKAIADRIDRESPAEALADLESVYKFLVQSLIPHEEAEEKTFYPAVGKILGSDEAVATMVRTHVEIFHLTRVLGSLLEDLTPRGPDTDDLPELRRILYGLHAILRLHFAQEEEAYLSLFESQSEGA